MSNAAKKLDPVPEPTPSLPPDGTRPVALQYWYLPYTMGAGTQHQVVEGGQVVDGCGISGRCVSLVLYPGGVVVAEIQTGFVPGRLSSEQKIVTEYLVLTGGHGKVKQ